MFSHFNHYNLNFYLCSHLVFVYIYDVLITGHTEFQLVRLEAFSIIPQTFI